VHNRAYYANSTILQNRACNAMPCRARGAVPCMHAMPHNTVQTEITVLNQTWYETVRNHSMVRNHATCETTRHIIVQIHAKCTTA